MLGFGVSGVRIKGSIVLVAFLFKRGLRYFLSSYVFAIWVLAVLAAVVTAPFGAHVPMDVTARLLFWALTGSGGIVLGHVIHALCQHRAGARFGRMAGWSCELGVFTVVFSPPVYLLARAPVPGHGGGSGDDGAGGGVRVAGGISHYRVAPDPVARWPGAGDVGCAWPRGGGICCTAPAALGAAPARGHRGPILHLSAMDHFVTVETPGGACRLRIRLRDAIDEMDGVAGLRTHRSHWVARAAIRTVAREEGRVMLVLSNGARVPVSRKYRSRSGGGNCLSGSVRQRAPGHRQRGAAACR